MTGSVWSSCSMPSMARRERDSARIHASISSGMRISRSVWPVGAVSKTIRSKRGSSPRIERADAIEQRHLFGAGHAGGQIDLAFGFLEDVMAEQALDLFLDRGDVALRLERAVDLESAAGSAAAAPAPARSAARRCRPSSAPGRWRPAARAGRRGSPPAPSPTRTWSCPRRPCRRRRERACRSVRAATQPACRHRRCPGAQQQGSVPSGDRSMPMRRCHWWNWSSR